MSLLRKVRFLVTFGVLISTLPALIALESNAMRTARAVHYRPVSVEADKLPPFPKKLTNRGVFSGEASLAVNVDEYGELLDWMLISATDFNLEKLIAKSIDTWRFEPASIDGHPVESVGEISLVLEADGATRINEPVESFFMAVAPPERVAYASPLEFVQPEELDQPLALVESEDPDISDEARRMSWGAEVVFEFYIDPQGRVRMPVLKQVFGDIHPDLAVAGNEALLAWRFAPLTKDGKPAVTRVSQALNFDKIPR